LSNATGQMGVVNVGSHYGEEYLAKFAESIQSVIL